MKIKLRIMLLAFTLVFMLAPFAIAQDGTGASTIIGVPIQGLRKNGTPVLSERSNPNNALGSPTDPAQNPGELPWFSLGFGGTITLGFNCPIVDRPGPDIRIYETTNGTTYPLESVEVRDPITNQFIGTATNTMLDPNGTGLWITEIDLQGTGVSSTTQVRITDTSNPAIFEDIADGFDLNAVVAIHSTCPSPVQATCLPTTNPAGGTVPPAGTNGPSQNPDGFYQIGVSSGTVGTVSLYISDTASNVIFGPFAPGTKIKLVQAPGATPTQRRGSGMIDWQIKLKGDAMVYGVDAFGNQGASTPCLVPPFPS